MCVASGDSAWEVLIDGDEFIAEWVPARRRAVFEAGLCVAERVDTAGIGAGRPVRAADGALSVTSGDGVLALLRRVPGRPLRADDPLDQQWWGDTLGAAHRVLRQYMPAQLARFDVASLPVGSDHLALEPWLGPALRESAAAVRRIMVTDQLTYGVLHGSPSAAAFRLDPSTGKVGLVGWTAAAIGPLLHDLAAAVLSAGGPSQAGDLVDGYAHASPVPRDECEAILPELLALRAALRASAVAASIHRDGGTPRDHAELTRLAAVYASVA
ncbi:serine kinase [Dactylosporangium sp. AC04546]|uniref:phosphotransferase enzyme family protein n=1 Tax=Dactylosporangium sp. AC04546 TaxID=2862460 RepID=UPI001EDFAE0B|nr:phosphotransferase [Dactylosporangium sp. AC04546]WVK82192.1 serine kinase [Dactylosporangium sp. AC04546]